MPIKSRPEPDLAAVAALLADPSRAAMIDALLDGASHTATELAKAARVTRQTASGHLARLVGGGLLLVTSAGREKRFRLASPEVSDALEALSSLARPAPDHLAPHGSVREAIRTARTCYDHLAGRFGVAVTDALIARGLIASADDAFRLMPKGAAWLDERGIRLETPGNPRPRTRACIDWSERRPHLGGIMGRELCAWMFRERFIIRVIGCRAVRLTDRGRRALHASIGLVL